MLPSTGYFRAIPCPFLEDGDCDRPHCHFRHVRTSSAPRPVYKPTPLAQLGPRRHLPVPYTPARPPLSTRPLPAPKPSTFTYTPTPLPAATVEEPQPDAYEPPTKKPKCDELAELDELGPELDIIAQIVDDEKQRNSSDEDRLKAETVQTDIKPPKVTESDSDKSKRSKHKSSHDKSTKKSHKSSKSSSDHRESRHSKSNSDKSKHKSHKSSRSTKDKHSSSKSSDKTSSRTSSKSSSRRDDKKPSKHSEKPEKPNSNNELNFIVEDDYMEIYSTDDEDTITKECLKIFEEYIPEVKGPETVAEKPEPDANQCVIAKKRVAHPSEQPVQRLPTKTLAPNHRAVAIQMAANRYSKVREYHNTNHKPPEPKPILPTPTNHSKIRIAHVPNVSTLLNAKKSLPKPVEEPKQTIAQTIGKGSARVAHIPHDKFSERPGVLEPLTAKIPLNVRTRYLNSIIDVCLQIYLTPEDAYARAQQEELTTCKKCSLLKVYQNSAASTILRLRKELQEANGIKKPSNSSQHGENNSWSIKNRDAKQSTSELTGAKFYKNVSPWMMSVKELEDNGFPRPHPDMNEKGRAMIYVKNTKQKPPRGNVRTCCRCKKEYSVDKKGFAVRIEECIYHPNNKYRFRGEVKYQCCSQDASSEGCLSAPCHVYEYVDYDNLRGYVKTLPKGDDCDANFKVYALDCEMCYTTNGLDLTRVTVIDSNCKVIYETLVKPIYPIIDYNTRFSGLTEQDMKSCKTSLPEVQATFLHMFSDKTILVGHSLESDFKALKLIHDTVIDTSVLFPHKMGPPYKRALRNLSSEYLRKIIQNSVDGHDSAEDATVCMELLIWKLKEKLKTQ